jgi:Leucine-rich repeat (LRR) protein
VAPIQIQRAQRAFSGILFAEDLPGLVPEGATSLLLASGGWRNVDALKSETLTMVDLSHNALEALAWRADSLPILQDLNLAANALASLGFISALPSLRFLDVSQNARVGELLRVCGADAFPKLRRFAAARCGIRSFANHPFPSLQSLDLSHNSLRTLEGIAVPSLLELDVSFNRISSLLELSRLLPCESLQTLQFHDNPITGRIGHRIQCVCTLPWLEEIDGKAVGENDRLQAAAAAQATPPNSSHSGGSSPQQLRVVTLGGDGLPPLIGTRPLVTRPRPAPQGSPPAAKLRQNLRFK